MWTAGQKALNDLLAKAMLYHTAEWDCSWNEILEVIEAVRHAVVIQRKLSGTQGPHKTKDKDNGL